MKYVASVCLVGDAAGEKYYQYTFIDEYSRFRYLESFKEHSTYSSTQFLKHVAKRFPLPLSVPKQIMVLSLQTKWATARKSRWRFLRKHWLRWASATRRSNHLRQGITARWSAATGKIMKNSMPATHSIPLMTLPSSLLFGRDNSTISPCARSTGSLPMRSFFLSPLCNTSLTNLQHFQG